MMHNYKQNRGNPILFVFWLEEEDLKEEENLLGRYQTIDNKIIRLLNNFKL